MLNSNMNATECNQPSEIINTICIQGQQQCWVNCWTVCTYVHACAWLIIFSLFHFVTSSLSALRLPHSITLIKPNTPHAIAFTLKEISKMDALLLFFVCLFFAVWPKLGGTAMSKKGGDVFSHKAVVAKWCGDRSHFAWIKKALWRQMSVSSSPLKHRSNIRYGCTFKGANKPNYIYAKKTNWEK